MWTAFEFYGTGEETGEYKYAGYTMYVEKGKIHNLKGPAVICDNGEIYWYIEGNRVTKGEWKNNYKVIEYRIKSLLKE